MMRTMKRNGIMAKGWLGLAALGLALAEAAETPKSSQVTLEFMTGETARRVIIELDEARAPQTCANFRKLVESGYYQELAVHRIIPNYLVQAGDPYSREIGKKHLWGTGGPDYTVPAELGGKHVRGSVAMARLPDAQNPRKDSNGSQFYVALDDLKQLDGEYTVFGKVVRGIEHLDYISQLTADTNDVPMSRVLIHRTALGDDTQHTQPPLAERAMKPVAAAADGLKDVSKAVASKLPLLGNKEEKENKENKEAKPVKENKEAQALASKPAPPKEEPSPVKTPPPPPPVPPKTTPPVAPPAAEPMSAPLPAVAASTPAEEHPKWPLLSKLDPSKLLVLGKKKDPEPGAMPPEQGTTVPLNEATPETGKKPFLPFFHKKSEEPALPEGMPPAPPEPKKEARKESPQPLVAESEKEKTAEGSKEKKDGEDPKEEKKEEGERKGFFGRMLNKVRPGGGH